MSHQNIGSTDRDIPRYTKLEGLCFKVWYNGLDQGSADYGLRPTPGPPPAFVNKVLLARGHAYSFLHCLWLLLHHSRVE